MIEFKSKFKNFQDVVIPGFLVNGERMDIGAKVLENGDFIRHLGQCLVSVNSVLFTIDENKLVDAEEFWQTKRMELEQKRLRGEE